jgi:hypothetical protein
MARIEREQISHALEQSPSVLMVKAEQDKIRLEHFVPLHPRLVQILRDTVGNSNGSKLFLYDSLRRYLQRANIRLSRTDGHIQLKDLRKYFEQMSDELGFTDAHKNYIMSHGVSSVNWQSYKQFLPETVYKNYMDKWANVSII